MLPFFSSSYFRFNFFFVNKHGVESADLNPLSLNMLKTTSTVKDCTRLCSIFNQLLISRGEPLCRCGRLRNVAVFTRKTFLSMQE